jgi:hypothetical protein
MWIKLNTRDPQDPVGKGLNPPHSQPEAALHKSPARQFDEAIKPKCLRTRISPTTATRKGKQMRSLEQKFSEAASAAKRAGVDVTPFLTGGSVEQRYNRLNEHLVTKGITIKESAAPRIRRNNGRSVEVTESDKNAARVQGTMKKFNCGFREASILCGLPDPGPGAKEQDTVLAERAARWKKYAPTLTETECQNLASRGIEP